MNRSLLSSRWFRIASVILLVFAGILIGLPYLIKHQARAWLEANGGERVEIRDVDFNPFTAELVLKNLLIEVEDRRPLHFDSARLKLAWLPLLEKHIDVRAVELQGFYLLINNEDILRIGGILLPVGESEPGSRPTAAETPAWLAGVHTLTLKDFTLVYHDAALDQRVYIDYLQLDELKQWNPEVPARLEYRGALNDAVVQLDAELAPFADPARYQATIAIDKLPLSDFQPLTEPALAGLSGRLSLQGDFQVEQKGDDIHALNEGSLELRELDIQKDQMQLANETLGWDGTINVIFNTVSSQVNVETAGELTVEDIEVKHQLALLSNRSLAWQGNVEVTLDAAASQTGVKSQGELTAEDTKLKHELASLDNRSLSWNGNADLILDTQSARTGVKSKGRLRSAGLDTDLHRQKLKFAYEDLDLDIDLGYVDGQPGTDITLNSELRVTDLDLLAPDRKIDIVRAQELHLEGFEIKSPDHLSVQKITAEELDLGRSLEQDTMAEIDNRSIFHAGQVLIEKLSHIDGFTAIDTIVENEVDVVYHRNQAGEWNVVSLLDALAGEETTSGESGEGSTDRQRTDQAEADVEEGAAEPVSAGAEPQSAAGPPPIAVKRVEVSRGSTATLRDESVTPAFKTTLTINELFLENLDGRKPEQTTSFKLDGQLDKHSSVKAGGDIRPYLQPPEMDIKGKLHAIGLPPLSPYATDSMGVMIDSGSLDVDLKLLSQNQLMNGEAVLLMHQLSVTGTDTKTGLQSKIPVPLDMALNILRDKNDTIELKIPIEGDANNPDFDVSDAITKAVAAGVSVGATSYLAYALQPYGAMIAVAKVAGEAASKIRLDPVEFEPGQAKLNDTARDYLSKIAKVLKERPKLAVKVCGVAVQRDVAQLQQPPPDKTPQEGGKPREGGKPQEGGKKEAATVEPVVNPQRLTELGEQRAASVKDLLVEKFQVPANRLANCRPRLETDKTDAVPRTDLLL